MSENSRAVNSTNVPASRERTTGWIKLRRSDETRELLEKDPLAFALLCCLALRARWREGFNIHSLKTGEALAGDYAKMGLTRQQYRTRLHRLHTWGFIIIKPTNRGTIVTLASTTVFDIGNSEFNQQTNHQPTSRQPSTNQRLTTNEELKKAKIGKNRKDTITDEDLEEASILFSDEVVESIYSVYPRKQGRKAAFREIRKALVRLAEHEDSEPVGWLLGRVEEYTQSVRATPSRYVKMPDNWFRDECYFDHYLNTRLD